MADDTYPMPITTGSNNVLPPTDLLKERDELLAALAVAIDDWEGIYSTTEKREAVKAVYRRLSEEQERG